MKHTVFISYSSMDKGMAFQIKGWLEDSGLSCWVDEYNIREGESWPEEIVKAIRNSKVLLLILTDNCVKSKHTHREVILADNASIGVIPIRIANVALSDTWNYLLCDRQWRDVKLPPPLESDIKDVAEAINSLMHNRIGGLRKLLPTTCVRDTWVPIRLPLRIQKKSSQLFENGAIQPSKMIECWNEFIPLIGRDQEMKWLKEFCYQPSMFKWAVVKGEGGMGKTRLAIELCKQCASKGWQAGFISKYELEKFVKVLDSDSWEPVVPTLIVVDYAAAKVVDLSKLLETLATVAQTGFPDDPDELPQPRIRLLLLEREADRQSGWLNKLLNASEQDRRRDIIESFEEDRLLKPPYTKGICQDYAVTREIIEKTMEAWSTFTGKSRPELRLRDEHWDNVQKATTNRPLYLQLAAIYACETGDAHALYHVSRTDLLNTAVDSEFRYIHQMCPENLDDTIERAVKYISGLLCLTGLSVIHRENWYSCVKEELMVLGIENLDSSKVSDMRDHIFPDSAKKKKQNESSAQSDREEQDRSAIQPDIIAAAFCYRVFQKEKLGFKICCLRALSIGGILAWPKLIRMVQDLHGLPGYENIAKDVTDLLNDRPIEELDELERLHLLPNRSISLAGMADKLFDMLIKHLHKDPSKKYRYAEVLVQKTIFSLFSGDWETGVDTGSEAIKILTELGKKDCASHVLLLGKAHHYVASCLENFYFRWKDGKPRDYAVSYLKKLYLDCGSGELADGLELYLQNIFKDWRDGRRGHCSAHYEAAIELKRSLYEEDLGKFAFELADSLNNQSNYYGTILVDPGKGLKIIQEAIDIAKHVPPSIREHETARLSRYYNVCAQRFMELKNNEAAREYLEKSFLIRHDLFHQDPDIHAKPYDITLRNYCEFLHDMGDQDTAAQMLNARLQCLMELSNRCPHPAMLDLANPCNELVDYYLSRKDSNKAALLLRDISLHVLRLPIVQPEWRVARDAARISLYLLGIMRKCWLLVDADDQDAILDNFIAISGETMAILHKYKKKKDAPELISQATNFLLGALYSSSEIDETDNQDEASIFLNWYNQNSDKSEKVNFRPIAVVAVQLALDLLDTKDPHVSLKLSKIADHIYGKLISKDDDPELYLARINALNNLCYIEILSNDLVHAEEHAEAARVLLDGHRGFQPHSFAYTQACFLETHARILLETDNLEKAVEAADIALGICLEQESNPLCSLGIVEIMLARLTRAKIDLAKGDEEKARNAVRAVADELDQLSEITECQRRVVNHELSWFDEHLPSWRE